jgi:hypothetical protein
MPTDELVTRTPSRRGGPHRVAITDAGLEVMERLAAEGNDQRSIAKALGLSQTAYRDLIERDEAAREALARGHGALSDELTHHLLTAARKGNITAAIYLTKARLGWIEGQAPDGAPKTAVQVNIQIPRAMTDAEFARVIEGTAAPARSREGGSGPPPAAGEVRP